METLGIILLWFWILILILSWVGLYLNYRKNVKVEENKTRRTRKTCNKRKYLDFVYLTDDEYRKLIEIFWLERANKEIEKLNNYIGSSGRKYHSHYYTIRSWNPWVQNVTVAPETYKSKLELRKGEIIFLHKAWWTHKKIWERVGSSWQSIGQALKRWNIL